MREILFRGLRLDNGEWIEGCFVEKKDPLLESDVRNALILAQARGDSFVTWFPVDPATVDQFTGLLANGKRIFEGDILRCYLGGGIDIGVVQYDDRIAAFIVLFTNGVLTFLDFFTEKVEAWYEVIGNIHDNPELLEVTPKEVDANASDKQS